MNRTTLFLLAALTTQGALAQTVFYGGDPLASDNQNYFATVNGIRSRMMTFDDFTWSSSNNLTGLFGYFVSNTSFSNAYFEIRKNLSAGNGGTLVSSGSFTVTADDLGLSTLTGGGTPFHRYFVKGSVGSVALTLGSTYHLAIALDYKGNGAAQGAVNRTSGLNGMGGPLANGNLFHDQPSVGINYQSRPGDVAYGMEANPTPEPATIAILGIGALALRRKRK